MSKFLDYPGLDHYTEKMLGRISQLGLKVGDPAPYNTQAFENLDITPVVGYFYRYNNLTPTASANYQYVILDVQEGEKYRIVGFNLSLAIPCAFVVNSSSNAKALAISEDVTVGKRLAGEYTVPSGYDKLYINGHNTVAPIMVQKWTTKSSAVHSVEVLEQKTLGDFSIDSYYQGTINSSGIFATAADRVSTESEINTGGAVRVKCGGDVRLNAIFRFAAGKSPFVGGTENTDYKVVTLSSSINRQDVTFDYDSDFPNMYFTFARVSNSSAALTPSDVMANVKYIDQNADNLKIRTELSQEIDTKNAALNTKSLSRAVGGAVPATLVQGGYTNGIPHSAGTRVRFERMFSIDELPIKVTIPDAVDAKLYGINRYSTLDDYTSYASYKGIVQFAFPKSFVLTKDMVGSAAGFTLLFSKASDSTANIAPSAMASATFEYQDPNYTTREYVGADAMARFYIDSTYGLNATYAAFHCPLKSGEWFAIDTTTLSSATDFIVYCCDSAGGNRTKIADCKLNKRALLLCPQDTDYLTVYVANNVTTPGDLDIAVYKKQSVKNYKTDIGVSGVAEGNFAYYGDAAISMKANTKTFFGQRSIFYSENWSASSQLFRNQSMAIHNGIMVLFQDSSMSEVRSSGQSVAFMDAATKTILGYADNPVSAHCNNAQFSDIYYNENDAFPLLMLSEGNYPSANSPLFHFIRIVESNGTYTLTVVKTITCTIPAALNNGSWVANFRQKRLWMYTFTLGPYYELEDTGNKFALYEFDLPDMSNWNDVTLSETDVKRYTIFDYCVMQGATEVGGLIYMPVQNFTKVNGLPFSGSNAIWVINPDLGRVVNVIPFTGPEPEGIDQYNGKLYVSQKNGSADETTELAFQIQEFDFGPED